MRRFAAAFVCCLLSARAGAQEPPPRASDQQEPEQENRAVPFDPRWLEPYFATGAARAAVERFRLDDWAGAQAGLTKVVAGLSARAPERGPARFLLALALFNRGAYAEAGPLFEDLYSTHPLLASYHALYAARCRLRRGDTAGAREWAVRVPIGSVPEAEAALVKLDALLAEQGWAAVAIEAERILETFPTAPRRAEVQFQRAQALEKLGRSSSEVIPLYRRIWSESPGEWSRRSDERITALAAGLPAAEAVRARTATAGEWVTRGLELFDRNQNQDAEAAMTTALGAPGLDARLTCTARFHRAQSVFKQRQRPRAAPLFVEAEAACRAAKDPELLVKALYQGARCLANTGDAAGATAMYAKVEAEFPTHSYADDARLRAAEVATDAGDEAQAAALLADVPNRYPQGDQAGEALWRLAFKAWRAGDLERTRSWLDETLRRYPREEIWYAEGRALYWKGRLADRENKPEEARAMYERAVREYPLSVYALLSLERLRRGQPEARAALVRDLQAALEPPKRKEPRGKGKARDKDKDKDESPGGWSFAPRAVFGEPGFLRAVELARLGLGSEAKRELAKIGFTVPESREGARKAAAASEGEGHEDVLWITAVLLDRGRSWTASHVIPRYGLTGYRRQYPASGRGVEEWRIAYPRAFPEVVVSNSTTNDVPSALQWAIMREESAFNPHIESPANALGLTQMLVKTAQRFSPTKVTRDTLLDPAGNLEVGSRFLSFLLRRFNESAPMAIAGYNAGEGAVDRWYRDFGTLELDEFMESIPFDETRNYTKRVLASYFTYSWLYEPRAAVPELSFALAAPRPDRVGRTPPRKKR